MVSTWRGHWRRGRGAGGGCWVRGHLTPVGVLLLGHICKGLFPSKPQPWSPGRASPAQGLPGGDQHHMCLEKGSCCPRGGDTCRVCWLHPVLFARPKVLALGKGRFLHRWRRSFDVLWTV